MPLHFQANSRINEAVKKKTRGKRKKSEGKDVNKSRLSRSDFSPDFAIVAIGASAGGLEALQELLKNLPADTGMAFTIVQHLDPERESHFPEILSRATRMPVTEVVDGEKVKPNHVYVIPGNAYMVFSNGLLRLTPRENTEARTLAIDHYFLSLAKDPTNFLVGVILSGTGSDGARGISAAKDAGGITFAQDSSAKFDGMPNAAVATGKVDFILPPKEIGHELARISQHPFALSRLEESAFEQNSGGTKKGKEAFHEILGILRKSYGMDFISYKPSTIHRRINRRMLLRKIKTYDEYAKYLKENPSEVFSLYEDLLIKVTSFFRDPDVFLTLQREVFPKITKGRAPDASIRIWVPACSTDRKCIRLQCVFLKVFKRVSSIFPSL